MRWMRRIQPDANRCVNPTSQPVRLLCRFATCRCPAEHQVHVRDAQEASRLRGLRQRPVNQQHIANQTSYNRSRAALRPDFCERAFNSGRRFVRDDPFAFLQRLAVHVTWLNDQSIRNMAC